ncbi:hypothetical protein NBRC10513v2_006244 [Rhodotorula toruloides]
MTTQEIASSNDPPELCWPWDGQPTVIGFLRDTVLIGTLLAVGRFMFGVTLDTLPKLVEELFGAWRETAASWFDVLPGNDPSAGYPLFHTQRTLWVTPLIPLTIRLLLALLPVRLDTSSCAVIYTASTGAYLVWWAGRQPGAVKLQYKEAEGKGKNE